MTKAPARGSASGRATRHPILCLVTDRRSVRGDLFDRVRDAVCAGVDWVQIRERELDGTALLEHAEAVAEAAREGAAQRGGDVVIIVNRRVDIALAIGADGVHLGFDAVTPHTARLLLGPQAHIGVSAHSIAEIQQAARPESAATYAHLAPIFAPRSKPTTRPPLGTDALATASRFDIPVFAQGGITPENAPALITAGAQGIAVTGTLLSPPNPTTPQTLRTNLDSTTPP